MTKTITERSRRSRWLLLALFAFLAGGVSPAWAQMTVLSEGFESNSLATNGWTNSTTSSSVITSGGRTGSYAFYFNYTTSTDQYLVSKDLSIPSTASNVNLSFYWKGRSTSYNEVFRVGYSTTTNSIDAFTWDDDTQSNKTTSWTEYTKALDANVKYIAIYYPKNNNWGLYIDDINLTCTVSGPAMSVLDGTSAISSGYNYSFGLATAGTAKTFTLKNEGTEACPVSVAHTGSFGAELSATSIPADGEVTLTVTMPATSGDDVITVSSTAEGIDDFIINVSGTVKDPSKIWCDFTSGVPTGWTNGGLTVSTSGAGTGTTGGGYIYDSGYNYSLTTPLLTFDGSEKMLFVAARTQSSASYCGLTVEYSANGTSWTSLTVPAVADIAYYYNNSWTPIELSGIPAGDYFIKFTLKYLRITDIYGGTESTAPVIALSQNSYDFGLIDANKTSEAITITNTGKSALTGLNITSNNANFTVNCEATEIAADGGTATFTVTMAPNATGAQTATITVKSDNADDLVFTATGAVAKEGTTTAIFNDATYAGWTASGSNLSFNGDETAAYFYYGTTNYLTSPKVNIVSDDFLAINAKLSQSYGYVTVQGSADGISWTDIKKLDSNVLNQTDYTTAIVSGISTDYKYLRLNGYYCYVKQVAGLNYAAVLVVKDAEEAAQTSGLTYPFGEVGANQSVSYTFSNAGSGTINITNVVSDNEVFTTNFDSENKPAVTSAEPFTLTITANYDAANAGEQNGTVTVTTSEGEFVINLTSTFLAANAPKMDFYIGEATEASTTGASLGFGIITANANKSIKIQNDGTGALNITSIALPDEDYTTDLEAAPTSETPLVIAAGSSKTIVFTLAANGKAIKTGKTITISAEGMEDFLFSADAYVLKDCETVNFADGVPSTWTNGGWSVDATTNKDIYTASSSKPYLTTPKMSFTANDFIIVNAKKYDNDNGDYIQIQYSTDNGANWTNLQKLDDSTLPIRDAGYSDIVVSNIPEGTNKLRFQGYYARIKTIAGLTYDDNDPKMGIYTDADCTVAATTTETKNFEFATETQTATYYIKNIGTGTMTLALGDQPAGFTQALDKTSVAAGEKATLTITMPAETKGYRNGTVTVNATDLGAFTVAVSGVMVDENKLNLDFTTANIPSTWTNTNWTKNDGGFIRAPYSYSGNATLESGTLTAEEGEEIVIIARSQSSSSSYTVGVNYKKVDAEEWSTLIAAANPGTTWTLLHAPIAEAGDYIFQFTGNYSDIQHIYGLTEPTEPVMVVYDGESVAAATYNFGNVANDADAEWTLTVKNEGKAVLEGLAAALSGEQAAHYSVNVTGLTDGNLAANATATITVKQLKDNLGAHTATLTISATSEGIADKVITLSGTTRDASKMYVDFADGNMPANWTVGTSWAVTSGYAQQTSYSTASALVTTPLTVAENETLTFEAARYSNYSAAELKARYSVDGGVTWSEYVDYASQITSSSFVALELTDVPAGTAVIEFYGRYVKLDNISGFAPTTAPVIALSTEEELTDGKYDFGQSLQAAPADKVFTITNNGNADLVSDIAANDDVEIALSGNGVTIDGSQVTVPAGKSATLTVSLKFDAANPGAKSGSVTIDSNDPVADVVLNFTANVLDATAVNIDFANNSKPEGFYSNGWTYTSGYAANSYTTEAEFITSLLTVADPSDVLSYQARAAYNGNYGQALTVSYSTDRKNWTEIATLGESDLTATFQAFTVSGLKDGEYYLRFAGARVYVDNITGWHFATPVAEHDLYISAANFPTAALIPATENGVEASAIVNSLRADETGVTAKLFFGETEIATAAAQDITMDGNVTFNFTGNVPAEEGTYAAKVVAYYSDNSVAFETLTTNVEVAHTRTLSITEFTREGDGNVDADENNQFDAAFNVTVQNTGSTAATPVVKIFVGETEVGTATADAEVAAGESKVIAVSVTDASAGEGGELLFTAKAYWTAEGEALATSASNIAIIVNAAAPKFALYQDATPVNDGDDVQFGLVKGDTWKTFEYSIKNEGNAPLVIKDVTVPAGFSYSDGALQNLYLYFYSDGTYNGDVAQFKYESENTVVARNVEVAKQGINFGVHEKDNWTNIYGWDESAVESIGTAVSLADGQTTANGWLNIPVGTYDVTWNTNDNTIKFDYQGIPAGESMTFWVSLQPEQGKVSGNLTFTYAVDATTDNTFTLALSGRSISEDTWTEAFNDYSASIPANWTNNGWSVAGEYNDNPGAAYTNNATATLMTPRLAATEGEELTFDVVNNYYGTATYAYSTDKVNWSAETTITGTGEKSFVAPADGNYYIRFTGRGTYLQNFVGFKLNPLEHDTEIAASSVPETGKQLNVYTASVTLKENAGKAEEVTAKLIVNSEEKATKAETLTANGQTVITLTWTPDVVISEAVKAYVTVTGTGIDLKTDEIDLTIAEVYTLDENSSAATVETVSDETIVLKRKFAEGWNTVCLPFDITDVEAFFGEGAVAYDYTGYTDGALNFTKVTELTASYPYIVYVKTAITADMTLNNITITSSNNQGWYRTYNNATFQGTYAPMAAGDMTGKWGVTSAAKIAKGTAEASMKGFRAYFELPGESARLAFFGEDGTTTFIGTISVEDGNVKIYDLKGRRVETMKRGQLYIKNGKKVMNK